MAIIIKSAMEVTAMRQAGMVVASILKVLSKEIRAGMITRQLDEIAVKELAQCGATHKEEGVTTTAMANFTEIDGERKVLGLSESATLKEIKRDYRTLAHRHHPNKHSGAAGEETEGTMRRLNWAHKLLVDYCSNYKYSFREEDVARTYPHDEYLRRYYYGWFEGI